jgi:hypothetical protein
MSSANYYSHSHYNNKDYRSHHFKGEFFTLLSEKRSEDE